MPSHEDAKTVAGEKVREAERALDDYLVSGKRDDENFGKLLETVRSARRELLSLLSR